MVKTGFDGALFAVMVSLYEHPSSRGDAVGMGFNHAPSCIGLYGIRLEKGCCIVSDVWIQAVSSS